MAPRRKQTAQSAHSGAPLPIMYQQMVPGFRSNMTYSQSPLFADPALVAQRQFLQPMAGPSNNQQMVIPPYFNPASNLPPPPPQPVTEQAIYSNMASQLAANSQLPQYSAGVGVAGSSMNTSHMNIAQNTMGHAGNNITANSVMIDYQTPQNNNGFGFAGHPTNSSSMNTSYMNVGQHTIGQAGNGTSANSVMTTNQPFQYNFGAPVNGSAVNNPHMNIAQHNMRHGRNNTTANSGIINDQSAQYSIGIGVAGPSMTTPSVNTPQPRQRHGRNGSTANSIMANTNPPQYGTGFVGPSSNTNSMNGQPTTVGYAMSGTTANPVMTNAGLPQNGMGFAGPSYNAFASTMGAAPSAAADTYQSPYSSSVSGPHLTFSPPDMGRANSHNTSTSPLTNGYQPQHNTSFAPVQNRTPPKSPSKRTPRKSKAAESQVPTTPTPRKRAQRKDQGEMSPDDSQSPPAKRTKLSLVTPNGSPAKVYIKDGQVYLNPKGQTLVHLADESSPTSLITVPTPVPESGAAAWNFTAPVNTVYNNPAPAYPTPANAVYNNPAPAYSMPVNTTSFYPAPVYSASVNRASFNPAPVNIARSDPASVEPTPVNVMPVNTALFDPALVDPAPANTTLFDPAFVNAAPLDPAPNVTGMEHSAYIDYVFQTGAIALDFTDAEWAMGPPAVDINGRPTWPNQTLPNQPQANNMAAPLEISPVQGMANSNQLATPAGNIGNPTTIDFDALFPELQNENQSQQISNPEFDLFQLQMNAENQSGVNLLGAYSETGTVNLGAGGQNTANLDDKPEETSADSSMLIPEMKKDVEKNEHSQTTETAVSQKTEAVSKIVSDGNITPVGGSALNGNPEEVQITNPVTFLKEIGDASQLQPGNAMAFLQSAFGFGVLSSELLDTVNSGLGQALTSGLDTDDKKIKIEQQSQANNMMTPQKGNHSCNEDLNVFLEGTEAQNAASPDTPIDSPVVTPVDTAAHTLPAWYPKIDPFDYVDSLFGDEPETTIGTAAKGSEWDDFDMEVESAFQLYNGDVM